jgi:SAM-dependent methyltransferase
MRWERKAAVARLCAALPAGDRIYKVIQRRFGGLTGDPADRLPFVPKFAEWITAAGGAVEGATVLEVGTGHKPTIPIGFFLLGAKTVHTYDLHRRLDVALVRESLRWIVSHRDLMHALLGPFVEGAALDERMKLLQRFAGDPLRCLEEAGIRYAAPADAARTGLEPESIDLHYSMTTLEHIPAPVISDILREAHRILRPDGLAVHFVDLSDHFSHADGSITAINFLHYGPAEWDRLAGNEFAYTNRLRASELRALYEGAGFRIDAIKQDVDKASRSALDNGFPLDPAFARFAADDLATVNVNAALRKAGAPSSRRPA